MVALILNQATYADPGHVGRALESRGIHWKLLYRETLNWDRIEVADYEVIVLLGSMASPLDSENPAVSTEIDLIVSAKEASVPVLGVCYGAELMAMAGGGSVYPLSSTCFGYRDIIFEDGSFQDSPQFFWNHLGFSAPSDSTVMAQGPESCWVFGYEKSLAVQFHPDADPTILKRWTQEGLAEITSLGKNGQEIVASAQKNASCVSIFCDSALSYLLNEKT